MDPGASKSLSQRLFAARLDLVRALDEKRAKPGFAEDPAPYAADGAISNPQSEDEVRADALKILRETVAGMNLDNFIVRQQRRAVEKYLKTESWATIGDDARKELIDDIAPLPSAVLRKKRNASTF